MSKFLSITLLIGLSLVLSACGGAATPVPGPGTGTPTAPATATATPAPILPSPGPTVAVWLNSCTLLSSRDAASLFTTAEVEGPDHQVAEVNHVIFSTQPISATEASCTYYVFSHPGQADMKLLQITYWLDVASQATAGAWDRVWTGARSAAGQIVSGVGDDAFFGDGRLSFRKGDVYVTVEVTAAGQNFDVAPGSAQQLDLEKEIALDLLPNMGAGG